MYAKLFTLAAVIGGALLISKTEESEENEKSEEFTNTVISQTVTLTSPTEETEPTISLRRGDRFICPETGEKLQVRAVGGRPRKRI